MALLNGHDETAKLLLEKGAKADSKNKVGVKEQLAISADSSHFYYIVQNGDTPFLIALRQGKREIAILMLSFYPKLTDPLLKNVSSLGVSFV